MANKKDETEFIITFSGSRIMTASEIWDPEEPPENPTVEEAVQRIKDEASSKSQLISEWYFEDDIDIDLTGRKTDTPTVEIKYP